MNNSIPHWVIFEVILRNLISHFANFKYREKSFVPADIRRLKTADLHKVR